VVRTKFITVTGTSKITLAFSLHNKDKTLLTPTSKPEINSLVWGTKSLKDELFILVFEL
jgi:hypothetical protein